MKSRFLSVASLGRPRLLALFLMFTIVEAALWSTETAAYTVVELKLDLDNCNLVVDDIDARVEPSISYQFHGHCAVVRGYDTNEAVIILPQPRSVSITVDYNFINGKALETILHGPGLQDRIETEWRNCKPDPWREGSPGDSCFHVSLQNTNPTYDPYALPRRGPGDPPMRPISASALPAVQAYIEEHTPNPGPLIHSPAYQASYSQLDPNGLQVLIGYDRINLYRFFDFPHEARLVEFRWERLNQNGGYDPPANVLSHVMLRPDLQPNIPRIIDAAMLQEGEWRLRARHVVHDGETWPWSVQKFWIGAPVDYTKPKPIITLPASNAVHDTPSSEFPNSYPVDFLIQYTGYTHPKEKPGASQAPVSSSPGQAAAQAAVTDGQAPEVEIEVNEFLKDKNRWGPYPPEYLVRSPNGTFTEFRSKGYWRIRARRKEDFSDPSHKTFPWTEWRHFLVGELTIPLTLKNAIGMQQLSTTSLQLDAARKGAHQETGQGVFGRAVRKQLSRGEKTKPGEEESAKPVLARRPPILSAAPGPAAKARPPVKIGQATRGAMTPRTAMTAKAAPDSITLPGLRVEATSPESLTAGRTAVFEIIFRNVGQAPSNPDVAYKVSCNTRKCPVPTGTFRVGRAVEPRGSRRVTLRSSTAAEIGEYQVTVAVPPDQMENRYQTTLTVKPALKPGAIKTGPKMKTSPEEKPDQLQGSPQILLQ